MFIQHVPASLHAAEISKQLYPMQVLGTRVNSVIEWHSVEIIIGLHLSRATTVLKTFAPDAGSHLQC